MSSTATHDAHHTPTGWKRWVYSTNHKDIGTMYLIFAIIAGIIGGALSGGIRLELQEPGLQYFSNTHMFNVFTTGHGLIMIFFMVMPCAHRGLWQLVRAHHDRRARHGLPAHEQHFLLAFAAGLRIADHLALR